ncbi:ABC transporter permease [Thermosipho atlanticus]|uniref:ABC-2 type transport system permease protein n=1 Tax=Thermosipho atlanticus DSM 15807 TaxID=1123380 RepID=A0A1M5TUQ2_9BACT|nr:ABC transporter permease [Thermosipho atlanticus]SHH54517.1 ABC-2 type transport system permease protein [Thermosipho atlanticus DSM 15807]
MRLVLELKRILNKPINIILIILLPLLLTIASIVFFNGFGIVNVKLGVYNMDNSPLSQFTIKLVMSFFKGGTLTYVDENYTKKLETGELNAVLIIPANFTNALYKGQKVSIDFIPSPVDLQLSVGIFNVLNSIFKDLSGTPFFDPKVLRYLFVSEGSPAPEFTPKAKNFSTEFGDLFSPAILFLSVVFLILSIGILSIVNDRELGLISIFKVNNEKWYKYALIKFTVLFVLGIIISLVVYFAGLTFGINIPINIFLPLALLGVLFHSSLSLILSSLSPNKTVANILSISFAMFFFFSSGSITPVSSLPKFMFKLASYTPVYKLTYAIRNYQLNGASILGEINYLLIISFITSAIMILTVKKEFAKK